MSETNYELIEPKEGETSDDVGDDAEDTFVIDSGESETTENVGELSVEINVEDLVAELEADGIKPPPLNDPEARSKLEELLEERRIAKDLRDMTEFDLED